MWDRCSYQLLSPSIPRKLEMAGLTTYRKGHLFWTESANFVASPTPLLLILPPSQPSL